MFCRHHFNPQGLRGLKVWEVSHACSNTEWQAPLMPGSSLALTTASLQILHMPLWDLMCHEGLWTGNWQALNGKFPQSWGVHQLWRLEPYHAWQALLDSAQCRPSPLRVSLLYVPSTASASLVEKLQYSSEQSPSYGLPLLLEGGKSRISEETMAVKVVPPRSKPQSLWLNLGGLFHK